jgi:hypothetical protein
MGNYYLFFCVFSFSFEALCQANGGGFHSTGAKRSFVWQHAHGMSWGSSPIWVENKRKQEERKHQPKNSFGIPEFTNGGGSTGK